MDFRPSTRPASVTIDGQQQQPAHEAGAQVRTLDQWQRVVAPGRSVEMNGRIYTSGEVITVTAVAGTALQQAGDVLPIGQRVKHAAPAVFVGRVVEADVMTQRHALPPLEGH